MLETRYVREREIRNFSEFMNSDFCVNVNRDEITRIQDIQKIAENVRRERIIQLFECYGRNRKVFLPN